MIEFTIKGKIPAKKNKQRISRYGGIYKDPEVRAYEEQIAWEVKLKRIEPIAGRFELSGEFGISDRKDLDGVLATILDSLQFAGIIENDRKLSCINNLKKIITQDEYATIRINKLST